MLVPKSGHRGRKKSRSVVPDREKAAPFVERA